MSAIIEQGATEDKNKRARQQAIAQAESIGEMVAALTREGAAAAFVKSQSDEQVRAILAEHKGEEIEEDADIDELREELTEAIEAEDCEPDSFEFDPDEAQQRIHEDPLEVCVRSGWYAPGDLDGAKPAQFKILLCTGGPAVRIIGDLSDYGEPERARIEFQDWFTPWEELVELPIERETLLTYCQQFYFGE